MSATVHQVGSVCQAAPAVAAAVIGVALLGIAPLALAQAPVINAKVERLAARNLTADVQSVADRGGSAWIGYRVPIALRTNARPQVTDWHGSCRLEPPTELVMLARVEAKTLVELRPVAVDCDVDAAGMPLVWLDGVNADQSVGWLSAIVGDVLAGRRATRLMDPALSAIALHAGAAASKALLTVARDGQTSQIRGQALVWLARRATDQAGSAIADAIERDPEVEVKKRAVFALSQLPRDEGVPLLLNVARTHKITEVRRQAMIYLGQSNDKRAIDFFEQVLLR